MTRYYTHRDYHPITVNNCEACKIEIAWSQAMDNIPNKDIPIHGVLNKCVKIMDDWE